MHGMTIGPKLPLVHKRLDHRIDNRIGFGAHLFGGRILDGVRDEDSPHFGQPGTGIDVYEIETARR